MVSLSLCRADQPCAPETVQRHAAQAKVIQARLLAAKVTQMNEVPEAIQQQIAAMKDALAAAVDAYLHCHAPDELRARQLQNRLSALLGANRPEKLLQDQPENTSQPEDQPYGTGLTVRVTRPAKEPQLTAIELSFEIECGVDTMLLVYERANGVLRRAVRWQSRDYDEISGAFGDSFQYRVIPNSAPDHWVVAAFHGYPWCTSRWSAFDVDVIEPEHGTLPQRVLFHKHENYVRDTDPVMKATSDGFELRLEKGCIDQDIMTRSAVYRYRVAGNKVERVQPVAKNGRDFVDEWLQTDWSDAAGWSESSNLNNLESEHTRFGEVRDPNGKEWPDLSYGPVRACSDDPKSFAVKLDQEPGKPTYFLIQQGDNSFTMRSISRSAFPLCAGPNLMPKE